MAEQIHNSFLEKTRRGEVVATLSIRLVRTNEIVVMAKTAGFDGIMLDMGHSTFDLDTVSQLCIAALAVGIAPLVRVPSADPSFIARVLDGGALGVIVPHVKTVADVRAIVQAAKYPPLGRRSEMSAMPHFQYRPLPASIVAPLSNESASMVIPMIETLEAVECVEETAAVPGVSALFLAGSDLSAEMGIPGQYEDPQFVAAYERITAAGNKHNVIVGLGGFQARMDLVEKLGKMGAWWVSAATDSGLFFNGAVQKCTDVETINARVRESCK